MSLEPILDLDHVRDLLTADAFTIDDPDSDEHGRQIVHTVSSHGFGADWDLAAVLELVDDDDVTWHWTSRGALFASTPAPIMPRGITFDGIRRSKS